jgi:hypothetical protein
VKDRVGVYASRGARGGWGSGEGRYLPAVMEVKSSLRNPVPYSIEALEQAQAHQIALVEAEPKKRTGGARILGEADAALRQEQSGLDPADRVFD